MTKKKKYFLQHKETHCNSKEVYKYVSKNMGKKVSFAAVFKVIIRRKAIPDEAYIYIAELIVNKTALKKET